MKKSISICFFVAFFALYVFGLYLLWNPQEEKQQGNQQIAVETDTETDTEMETAESMKLQTNYAYRIAEKDGWLVIYKADSEEIFLETNIKFSDLDETMQKRVQKGIQFTDESGLYDFLESYSS